jgi:hypothetical protein
MVGAFLGAGHPLSRLDDATLVPTIRKPFDVLAEGLVSSNSRGDWTAIELFLAGLNHWPVSLLRAGRIVADRLGDAE